MPPPDPGGAVGSSAGKGTLSGQPRILLGARHILAVRPDNIGDVVMLGPALRALRREAPDARLTLLASPAGGRAADLLPWIDDVLVERVSWQQLPDPARPWDAGADRRLIERLADGRFDAAFVFTSFSQSPWPAGYACLLAGIPIRAGQAADFGGAVLTHVAAPAAPGTHQVDRNLHLLETVGVPVEDRELEVRIPASARSELIVGLRREGIEPGTPYVVVAPGASAEARRYPVERFAEAARAIVHGAAGAGLRVVLAGGPEDVERLAPVATVGGIASLAGRTSLPQLAALIAGSRAVVTSHSAPVHLADALGVPLVVAWSGTDLVSEWGPRRSPSVLLAREVRCAPCRNVRCPYGLECLDVSVRCAPCRNVRCPYGLECLDVSPDELVAALARLVAQTGTHGATGHPAQSAASPRTGEVACVASAS